MRACYRSLVPDTPLQRLRASLALSSLKHPVRLGILATLLVGLSVAGWYVYVTLYSPLVIDAPAPAIAPDLPDEATTIPASVVEAPITYDLAGAMDSLEREIGRAHV